MKRMREVKQYGGSYCIHLELADRKDFNIEVGDLIDIKDIVVIKKNKRRQDEKR